MRNILIIILSGLLLSCATQRELQRKDEQINQLTQQNQQLQQKNADTLGQNKRLRTLIEKVLQRLAIIQEHYKKLVQENMELYQKLYHERMAEQKQLLEERKKHLKDLEKEVQTLVQDDLSSKEKIHKLLMERRQKLVQLNLWTIKDERYFMDIADKLKSNLTPEQERQIIPEALRLEAQLAKKAEQSP